MPNCPDCGTEVGVDEATCTSCGRELATFTDPGVDETGVDEEQPVVEGSPSRSEDGVGRRDLLKYGAGAAILGSGGWYVFLRDDASDASDWTGHRGETANTGQRADPYGPGDSLSASWEVTTRDLIQSIHDVEDPDRDFDFMHFPIGNPRPIVIDDTVFWNVGYEWGDMDDRQHELVLVAVDAADGSLRWTSDIIGEDIRGLTMWYGPVADGDYLYVPVFEGRGSDGGFDIARYDPSEGDEIDRLGVDQWVPMEPPVVENGMAYLVTDSADSDQGIIQALSVESGEVVWEQAAGRPGGEIRPHYAIEDDHLVFFDRESHHMYSLDPETGEQNWAEPLDLPASLVDQAPGFVGQPSIIDDTVYAAASVEQFTNRDIATLVSIDLETGTENWQSNPPPSHDPAILTNLSPERGEEEREHLIEQLDGFSSTYGQPLKVQGSVITTGVGEVDGESGSFLFSVDDEDGSFEWGTPIEHASLHPVIAGETIYVPTDDRVEAFSFDGDRVDSIEIPAFIPNSPAVGSGGLYIPSADDGVGITGIR